MNESTDEMVTITLEEYAILKDDSKLLCALRAAGVDNWEGYEEALEAYLEDETERK